MQEIQDFTENLQYWSNASRALSSLEKLSTAAHVAVSCPDAAERVAAKGLLLRQAQTVGCRGDLERIFRALESENAQERLRAATAELEAYPYLTRDGKGRIARTIANFSAILATDPYFA